MVIILSLQQDRTALRHETGCTDQERLLLPRLRLLDSFYGGMFMKTHFGLLYAFLLVIAPACGKAAAFEEGRGEMLYQNHCVACHTTQLHWRDQRLAKDWSSLRAQVHRWEKNTGLTWSEEDIEAVSQYLNQLYYQFPEPPKDKTISMSIFLRNTNRGQAEAALAQGFLAGE